MADRCTGDCCERFTLGEHALDMLTQPGEHPHEGTQRERAYIRDMVIVLESCEDKAGGPGYSCTCRHFDPETRNCTAYDDRPWLCRNYGTAYPCTHNGCQWDGACRA